MIPSNYYTELSLPNTTSIQELEFQECHVVWKGNNSRKVDCEYWTYEKLEGEEVNSIVTKVSKVFFIVTSRRSNKTLLTSREKFFKFII